MTKKIKHLVVISGPTASGKTALSIALAKHFETCVLSADSRQFYKELEIGTAKPTPEEMDGVPHFFIDSHHLTDEVTAAQFETEALDILEKEFQTKDLILLTGGSGMFVDALCEGLDPIPTSKETKAQVQSEFEQHGLAKLLEELENQDPSYFSEVDQQNPMRVMRAIEVIRITGKPYSELRKAEPKKRPFAITRFVINHPREKLYERINLRVDLMMKAGLLNEVESVNHLRPLTSLNTVGYSELFDYLDGTIPLEEAVELIKRNSRRYAKRQLTWFRRNEAAIWIDFKANDLMTQEIIAHIDHLNLE